MYSYRNRDFNGENFSFFLGGRGHFLSIEEIVGVVIVTMMIRVFTLTRITTNVMMIVVIIIMKIIVMIKY